jgi:hypothetical protein
LIAELKLQQVNDTCYVDTFFSSVKSVKGFTCWTQYSFKKSGYDVAYLMQHCSQGPLTLPKMVTDCGAPLLIKSDNAPEFKGKIGLTTFRNTRFHLNLQKPSIQMKTIVNIMEELSRQLSFIF